MKKITYCLTAAIALILLSACGNLLSQDATLEIVLGDMQGARLIVPDGLAEMISRYDLELTDGASTVKRTVEGTRTVVTGLTPGVWMVDVAARDSGGLLIARGEAMAEVVAGSGNTVTVALAVTVPEEGVTTPGWATLRVRTPYTFIDIAAVEGILYINDILVETPVVTVASVTDLWGVEWTEAIVFQDSLLDPGAYFIELQFSYYGNTNFPRFEDSLVVYPGMSSVGYFVQDFETQMFKAGSAPQVPVASLLKVSYQDPSRSYPRLSWNNPAPEPMAPDKGYAIYKSNSAVFDPGLGPLIVLTPDVFSYLDETWLPGVKATYYHLVAFNAYEQAEAVTLMQPAVPPNPAEVYVISSSAEDPEEISIYWDEVVGVDVSYKLYAADSYYMVTNTWLLSEGLTHHGGAGPFVFTELLAILPKMGEYYFTVTAIIGEEESRFGFWKSDSTSGSNPGSGIYLSSGTGSSL